MKTIWMIALAWVATCFAPCQANPKVCGNALDIYVECDALTPKADSLVLTYLRAPSSDQHAFCVDKRAALIGIKPLGSRIQKLEDTGDLVVITAIDSSRAMDLLEFSKKYIGRNIVIAKEGRVLRVSTVRSLLPSGRIASGVGSQGDADTLLDAIAGQCSLRLQ